MIYQIQQTLSMKCPYSSKCSWKGAFTSLNEHLEACKFVTQSCKYSSAGCTFEGSPDQLKDHEESKKDVHLEMCLSAIHILTSGGKLAQHGKQEEEAKGESQM